MDWPSTTETEYSASYGVFGNPYLSHDCWEFPLKANDERLNVVENSKSVLKRAESEMSYGPTQESEESELKISGDGKLISDFDNESIIWQSDYVIDPVVGKLFGTYLIKRHFKDECVRILCYVSGQGTVFNLVVLNSLWNEGILQSPDSNVKLRTIMMMVPRFGNHVGVDLNQKVCQIEFPVDPQPQYTMNKLFAVRTFVDVFIFRIKTKGRKGPVDLILELVNKISNVTPNSVTLADVTFSSFDLSYFVIIDIHGNYTLWRCKASKPFLYKTSISGSVDSDQVSKWKKIIWGNRPNEFFVFDRRKCWKIHWDEEREITVTHAMILPKQEHFLNIETLEDDSSDFMILTSHNILWVKFFEGSLKTVLSWAHLLNPKDYSLRMSINSVKQSKTAEMNRGRVFDDGGEISEADRSYIAVIHSSGRSINYLVQLNWDLESRLHTINGIPSYFYTPGNKTIIGTCLLRVKCADESLDSKEKSPVELKDYFALLQLWSDYEIPRVIVTNDTSLTVESGSPLSSEEVEVDGVKPAGKRDNFMRYMKITPEIEGQVQKLMEPKLNDAKSVGAIDDKVESFLKENLLRIEDLKELSLRDQLIKYLRSTGSDEADELIVQDVMSDINFEDNIPEIQLDNYAFSGEVKTLMEEWETIGRPEEEEELQIENTQEAYTQASEVVSQEPIIGSIDTVQTRKKKPPSKRPKKKRKTGFS